MYYPETPYNGKGINTQAGTVSAMCGKGKNSLLNSINEIDFALTELNLYLDTHPTCKHGLELFKKLSATLSSYIYDYEKTYGPLTARKSNNPEYFTWVSDDIKWPWQREVDL